MICGDCELKNKRLEFIKISSKNKLSLICLTI
jgi:hypothetical protein